MNAAPRYPDLAGKVALVTGGSRGIGASTAVAFAGNGVRVAVLGRDQQALEDTVAGIRRGGGEAIAARADITDLSAIDASRRLVEAEFGPVNILAAFAGSGGGGVPQPIAQMDEQDWRETIDGYLTSVFLTLRSLLPGMIERRNGVVITMSSAAGRVAGLGASGAYAASKSGVQMLTRQAALEAGPFGVRVNCIAPSTILTERIRAMPEKSLDQFRSMHPLSRLGEPEDVAATALFLASDASSWLTGITVDVAGGLIAL